MSVDDQGAGVSFEIRVPDELRNGVYADFLSVWSGPHSFTLDFAVLAQPQEGGGADVVCNVVARVKIPLTIAEDILRAFATNVTRFEENFGRIRKPGEDMNRPEEPR